MIGNIEKYIKRYCKEYAMIENYEEAVNSKERWECHHRLELDDDGNFLNSRSTLKRKGLYFDRPPEELIFLPRSTHRKMHIQGQSEETRSKLSQPGQKNGMFGKHWSEEDKIRLGASQRVPKPGHRAKSHFCQKYGMTKRELAAKLGIPSGSVCKLEERGRLAELVNRG
jgi:hypothetical protein